jgi:hypothetical protein
LTNGHVTIIFDPTTDSCAAPAAIVAAPSFTG